MLELISELDYHVDVTDVDDAGNGPYGHRMIATAGGGEFAGDRLKGTIVGVGGDWLLVGDDGYARLDVRSTFRTVDGAHIFLHYSGLLQMTPGVLDILAGSTTPTQFGDQYFVTAPRMETGDERYTWVNRTQFVGEGRMLPGPRIEYRVYRVAPSEER